ncbi:MAG: hypothetical protein K0R15_569 [Clostridiales bacterium]|jgi:hypothetical protein|nr:hypothetical protein [Clostridiales bacterium]
MKKLKILCAILYCFMLIFLQGCNGSSLITERLKSLELLIAKEEKANLQMSKDVLNCFNDDDAQGLKSLLCLKTRGLVEIDEQISACFDFFKGKVISFDEKDMSGYEGKSIEYGETTFLERVWSINNIITDTDETYEIHIRDYYICENDKAREGISQITITSSTEQELVIGYRWPLHDNEGRDMSIEIVKKFDARDKNGLKVMLCATTLDIEDIDKQIQAGLDFYEGKATWGKVGTDYQGHELYNGKHDWYSSVSDDETIVNGVPTRTSIDVQIYNIETDLGNIYKITFYADLLNKDDETREGITQIIIESDDGIKQVIGERLD